MLKDGALPHNIDPSDPKIDDPAERTPHHARIRATSSPPTGYVLPIQHWGAQAGGGWISELWQLRRRRLFLVPGDSPVGLRLPLSSLPHVKPIDEPHLVPETPSPNAAHCPTRPPWRAHSPATATRDRQPCQAAVPRRSRRKRARSAQTHSGAHRARRRAARRHALRVHAADRKARGYLELLAAVEATATELNLPLRIEGYLPPADPRLNVIKVTPDPGVIESISIHPHPGAARSM